MVAAVGLVGGIFCNREYTRRAVYQYMGVIFYPVYILITLGSYIIIYPAQLFYHRVNSIRRLVRCNWVKPKFENYYLDDEKEQPKLSYKGVGTSIR